ncbi:MAG: BrnT family toxin [Terracidiphilus sp.]
MSGFEWHPFKAASNLKKHKVSFEEASTIFRDRRRIEVPDQWHSDAEQRYLGIGRSVQGRILSIYYTFRARKIRIISARLAERWERTEYETGDEQERN